MKDTWDDYFIDKTDVLKNKLGIISKAGLYSKERNNAKKISVFRVVSN